MIFPMLRTETGHQIAQLNCMQIVREGSQKVVVHIMLRNGHIYNGVPPGSMRKYYEI